MDALWIVRTGIESSRARKRRSVCVVALSGVLAGGKGVGRAVGGRGIPEGVSDDKEGYVGSRSVGEDSVRGGLDHFSVCDNDRTAVEILLGTQTLSASLEVQRREVGNLPASLSQS